MRTIEQMISSEVLCCMSHVIGALAPHWGALQLGRDDQLASMIEQAGELAAPLDDWEEAAIQAGWALVDKDPSPDATSEGPCLYHAGLDRAFPPGDWREACEDVDAEPYQREIFEHWAVTDWFADKLEAAGEKVDKDFAGLNVWARTTTGQAIYADSVVETIYARINQES